jgi:hypothetical protein
MPESASTIVVYAMMPRGEMLVIRTLRLLAR